MIGRADVGDKILFEKEPFFVGFASWDLPFQCFFPETVGGDMEEGRRLVESEGCHFSNPGIAFCFLGTRSPFRASIPSISCRASAKDRAGPP